MDEKAAVWRSSSNAAQTLLLSWAVSELVDSVCMAWTNLTGLATVRLKGYTVAGDYPASPIFDQTFNPDYAMALGEFVWGIDPLAVSGAARARVSAQVQCWLAASYSIEKLEIIVDDPLNALAYVEASRLVIGQKISPLVNADQNGFTIGWVERSKPTRAASGDLRVEPLTRFRQVKIDLNMLEATSRNAMLRMAAGGLGRGVWISAFPEDADTSNQQLYGFWGALVQDVNFSYPEFGQWAAPMVFEEMG
jgi:hypothetical protein